VVCEAVPATEQFKPIPQLAAIIRANRQAGDLVALQGVSGLNSLMFYTAPPVTPLDSPDVIASSAETDPALILHYAPRVFLIAPTKRPVPDPTYGRLRTTLAFLTTGAGR
jgi:hypothetical protein